MYIILNLFSNQQTLFLKMSRKLILHVNSAKWIDKIIPMKTRVMSVFWQHAATSAIFWLKFELLKKSVLKKIIDFLGTTQQTIRI